MQYFEAGILLNRLVMVVMLLLVGVTMLAGSATVSDSGPAVNGAAVVLAAYLLVGLIEGLAAAPTGAHEADMP